MIIWLLLTLVVVLFILGWVAYIRFGLAGFGDHSWSEALWIVGICVAIYAAAFIYNVVLNP